MALVPSPSSSPSADPPVFATAPPPQPLSSPPVPSTSSSQQNASSPTTTPVLPPQSPLFTTAPPPVPLSPPPPQSPISLPPPPDDVPPPSLIPPDISPLPPSPNPPSTPSPPPLPGDVPAPPSNSLESSPPPPSPNPPSTPSPPPPPADVSPPSPNPPDSSFPPPSPNPPSTPLPPPTPSPPATLSPPPTPRPPLPSPPTPTPPTPKPPATPPTPPSELPKTSSTPPSKPPPPEHTPTPPSQHREKSPPPKSDSPQSSPATKPPSPPTPIVTPPPSPPSSNSPLKLSPPLPAKQLSPPSPALVPPSSPSLPSPSQVPIQPSGEPIANKPNTPSNSNSRNNGGIGTGGTVAIGFVFGLILLGLIGTAVWCVRKRKRRLAQLNGDSDLPTSLCSSPKSDSALLKVRTSGVHNGSVIGSDFIYSPTEPSGFGTSRPWFTYQELVDATNGFSMQNLLGEGGFGSVYKGYIMDGTEVAVKQLKVGGGQGEREFKAEVEIISRVHHRHLVSLVGYCIYESQRLLVYDYVPNNNLYFHLHGEGRPVMEWATRIKVAAGAARGISYLHEDCHPRIIHRDIKSSNILLDNSFDARVSDFGLAKLALDANTHITTRVMGTFGYMAPEYASSGMLTEKSDVYSFGVVLLELITGRKPVDTSQPLGDESLVEWARPLLSHALEHEDLKVLADPRLENNYAESEMFTIVEAAAACVRHSAAKRPRMGQVVRAFDSMDASDLTNGMRFGESLILNSAQQSAEIRLFQMTFGRQDYRTDSFSQTSLNS